MKKLAVLFAFALSAIAQQQTPQQARKPDCLIYFTLTNSVLTSGYADNRAVGCYTWAAAYTSSGFTGLTVTVQQSLEQSNTPVTWTTFTGTGNPSTVTTAAIIQLTGYPAWARVQISGLTGTGTVKGILFGFLAGSSSTGGGGGSGTVTSITATAPITVSPNPITNTGTIACPTCTTTGVTLTADQVVVGAGTHAVKISNVSIDPSTSTISTPGSIKTGVGGSASGELDQTGVTSGNVVAIVADDDTPAATVNNSRVSGRLAVRNTTFVSGNCVKGVGTDGLMVLTDAGAPCGSGGGGGSGFGITGYSGTGATFTGTLFFPYVGGLLASSTESNVDLEAPNAATISNFYVQLSAALGLGNTTVFTWRKNGADTALTCTITGASATSCNDTAHTLTVAQGDLLDVKAVTTGTVVSAPSTAMASQFGIAAQTGVLASLFVATDESTTSTSFVNLTTPDSVTFTLTAASKVLIMYSANAYFTGSGTSQTNNVMIDGVQVDPGNTALSQQGINVPQTFGTNFVSASLAIGSHTVTIQHEVSNFTGHWRNRLTTVLITP